MREAKIGGIHKIRVGRRQPVATLMLMCEILTYPVHLYLALENAVAVMAKVLALQLLATLNGRLKVAFAMKRMLH